MSSPQPQAVLTPQQQLLLKQAGLPLTPQNIALMQLTDTQAKIAAGLQGIYDRLGAISDQLLKLPLYVREQYNFQERKLMTLPSSATFPYYEFKIQNAAILLIITDSIIQFDLQPLSPDSPQLSGNAATYATLAMGVDRFPSPKRLYAKLVSGATGNVWLMIGN